MRKFLWNILSNAYPFYLKKIYGMHLGRNVRISYKARLDKSINPKGIYIGDNTWVLANSTILAHDYSRSLKVNTKIGNNCVIGINAIILPGVTLGDHVVIGAGSVVTKDVKNNSIAVGNPAMVIKEGVSVDAKGKLIN